MPASRQVAQARGRIGGLRGAALAPSRQGITAAARAAGWQKYVDQVKAALPDLTDEADIQRRAGMLRTADMHSLALKSAKVRRMRAELRALESELDASGLLDAGND
jgi:hypothetical protein